VNAMKRILLSRGQPSRSILRFLLLLVISTALTVVGMSAEGAIVNSQNRSMRLTGIVSDTMCGRTHGTKNQGDAECTRVCVKFGAEYALVVGKKIYVLQGRQAELNSFAGDMVVVRGSIVNGNTFAVESVAPYTMWAF